ncbi:hypothetical protein SBF1_2180005 [Candidatus Desulfosporosinus infrequens]|uniref:Uncharacterized protein n=1 Tax=Candidatus Desulfosporosinus infrequens TaxID=2043169 RepID=A0A2U3KKF6_9FIRM|nr:hypothetical protein SBF1_2180005 [Candidatus Desulfosporosinus infrequens]
MQAGTVLELHACLHDLQADGAHVQRGTVLHLHTCLHDLQADGAHEMCRPPQTIRSPAQARDAV